MEGAGGAEGEGGGGVRQGRVEKTCQRRQLSLGTFLMAGEHFRSNLCCFSKFIENYALLTIIYNKFSQEKNRSDSLVVEKAKKETPILPWL